MQNKPKRKRKLRWQIKVFLAVLAVICTVFLLIRLAQGNTASSKPDTANTEDSIVVLIDPGHGGYDPGNIGVDGSLEKYINLDIANKVAEILRNSDENITVYMTHNTDAISWTEGDLIEDLTHRVDMQSTLKADYFISLHCNSFEADPSIYGYNFFINDNDERMTKLSNYLGDAFEEIEWSRNNGIITMSQTVLQVVKEATVPSILVEMGYMTNASELAALQDEDVQDAIAQAIASGFLAFLQDEKENPTPTVTNKPETTVKPSSSTTETKDASSTQTNDASLPAAQTSETPADEQDPSVSSNPNAAQTDHDEAAADEEHAQEDSNDQADQDLQEQTEAHQQDAESDNT